GPGRRACGVGLAGPRRPSSRSDRTLETVIRANVTRSPPMGTFAADCASRSGHAASFARLSRTPHLLSEVIMRVFLPVVATAVAAVAVGSVAFAGGYSHGNGSGTCSFAPTSALVGQQIVVNATGLPTGVEVDLIVTNYEATTHGYGPLTVSAS